jgi:hypothetical protein
VALLIRAKGGNCPLSHKQRVRVEVSKIVVRFLVPICKRLSKYIFLSI